MKFDLKTSVDKITRVGKATAGRLRKLDIETVLDLIFYYPFRWQDFSQIVDISDLKPTDAITIKAKIQLINSRRSFAKKKILTEALVSDKTGTIKVIWFNQPFLTKVLKPGDEIYLSGKVDFDRYSLQFINPIYEKVALSQTTTHTARLVPIYSVTSNLTGKQLRFLIKSVMPAINLVEDWLPKEIIKNYGLVDLHFALSQIHFPKNKKCLDQAVKRLKFDELFLFQLQVQLTKKEISLSQAKSIKFKEKETKDFVSALPFRLTDDQRKAAWQIISDVQKSRPMNRLLEGEVGSGKTLVAIIAMLNTALNCKQAVLLAPTEILASQHYKSIFDLLRGNGIKTALLSRSYHMLDGKEAGKKEILNCLKTGLAEIIVGTHSLIQENVTFKDLALAIIDEQHRFGVNQRKHLCNLSGNLETFPHFLSMTATPIPRSLALTLYGDLEISIIKQLPKDRKKIITKIIDYSSKKKTYEFMRKQIRSGRQAFVICPLIDPSDKLGVKSVSEEYEKLSKEIFPDLKIKMLHGRLKSVEKEKIMVDFLAEKSDILVATSVIEVGVDVPNASIMLIEGADRFGLAQLHQFRGRVGRGQHQSYCFLFSENKNPKTCQRLLALTTAKDGFELAELDLQLRGPGEIYGTIQSGFPEFKIAKFSDVEIINQAKEAAEKIVLEGIEKHSLLKEKMAQLSKSVHLE